MQQAIACKMCRVYDVTDLADLAASVDLPVDVRAPGRARRLIRDVGAAWQLVDADFLETAALIMSELVTNAVVHGGGSVCLGARLRDDTLRLSASDGSSVLPDRHHAAPGDAGGRGLMIIEALSLAWGTETRENGGKRVWVDLPVPPAARRLPDRR